MSKKGNSTFVFAIRVFTFKTYPSFQEGNWIWIRINEKIDYNAWDTGEPNDDLNMADEDCLHLIFDGTIRYSWNDYQCGNSVLRGKALKPLCQKSFE